MYYLLSNYDMWESRKPYTEEPTIYGIAAIAATIGFIGFSWHWSPIPVALFVVLLYNLYNKALDNKKKKQA